MLDQLASRCPSVLIVAPGLLAAGLVGNPSTAEACSEPLPTFDGTIPADGDRYPGDAALLVLGGASSQDAVLEQVAVTVDGEPAALIPATDLPALAFRVEPMPAPGQVVTLEGNFCDRHWDPCEASVTYTADNPLEQPPPAVVDLRYDAVVGSRYEGITSLCEECWTDQSGAAYSVQGQLDAAPGDVPLFLRYRVSRATDPENTIADWGHRLRSASFDGRYNLGDNVFEGNECGIVCVEVQALDAAGNLGEPTSSCAPQGFGAGLGQPLDDEPRCYQAPQFDGLASYDPETCAALVRGGGEAAGDGGDEAAGDGGGASGGDTDQGCRVSAPGHAAGWMLLLVLGLGARSRGAQRESIISS